ncbi:type III sulfide quinone reductase, selenoprotein subtype [Salisediminibacterium halotolerans]|uniref:type III sulfide quinone reductase, selenoprotein subtype n=1 Tax=Salisediminibacterium halotolerans TaxID=517425 RepID=UPI000EAC945E|nr:FAD/NAD(P)-binding oxidoreductase [Salisediminibacterium halotolerans]RLJ78336.1 sulfide:quinone oxidoreductase [Actinophytocola xinjiangensis]RPE88325.1 sulfide:quinone oxidoreductase [Salisediminibacterium halotolerans]TWG37312.1 sulfide:quinone oxidoreductase [Salisediminibacterium halotolerans]GEL08887.1 oxidoreductase [Salisediminibacterium halotolerans]
MKQAVILGGGTAGTMMANHLNKKLDKKIWQLTVIDETNDHYYQPGFLFLPFGKYSEKDVVKKREKFLPKTVAYILAKIDKISPEKNEVYLSGGKVLTYDLLIIATGNDIAPELVKGIDNGWRENIFDFYTFDGAVSLRNKLKTFKGGKMVVHMTEMPIKCPVAPIEFALLADEFFHKQGIRDQVEIEYVTSLPKAFPKPSFAEKVHELYEQKNIRLVTGFALAEIDGTNNQMVGKDGSRLDYDLLVTVPPNKGNEVIARSGMGNARNYVAADPHTLQAKNYDNIFVVGDASDIPTSKAGSTAHFSAEILAENIEHWVNGTPMTAAFDGHANCYIESGFNKALLIDFNYDHDPMPGTFPLPKAGPFKLMEETTINHYGKMAFKQIYWRMLLKGVPMPTVPPNMKRSGKRMPDLQEK